MAICPMVKVIIVSHRAESTELLESLQGAGICQILNADEAMVSKQWPELGPSAERPRETESLLNRLRKAVAFLKDYAKTSKGLAGALAPRSVIDAQTYEDVISDKRILGIIEECEQADAAIEKLKAEQENLGGIVAELAPWVSLETPVEEIGRLEATKCLTGLIPVQQFEEITEQIGELGGAVERIGEADNRYACLIVCLNEQAGDVQKLLRAADFEAVNFESMSGTVADLIKQHDEELEEARKQLRDQYAKAASLSENLLKLEILCDHYANLLEREQTGSAAPTTEQTVILEGWVKEKDFGRLEKVVSGFGASSLNKVEPAEDEEVPVEIENNRTIKPFEIITRLYGMPQHFEVDPTVFLAPFFALFFGLCLTDAGYGLVMIAAAVYFIKKVQGDKRFGYLFLTCSILTLICGALMGGWFGDAVQKFVPALEPLRVKMMLFDPMQYPLKFFALSLVLGYIQIMFGLFVAFVHDLKRKLYVAAVCDRLIWLVILNSVLAFALAKVGKLPPQLSSVFGYAALVSAGVILFFSERQGGWGARIGIGFYNLFSGLFYIGDILSYLRLMALGLVTAGLAMAVNQIAELVSGWPFGTGLIAAAIILVGGHLFNLAINALGAFVHTLRLQYAEFFPKFFEGGGSAFKPLEKNYKHVYIRKTVN